MSFGHFILLALFVSLAWTIYEWRRGLANGENEWTLMNDREGR